VAAIGLLHGIHGQQSQCIDGELVESWLAQRGFRKTGGHRFISLKIIINVHSCRQGLRQLSRTLTALSCIN
jgi:hypothetical protein